MEGPTKRQRVLETDNQAIRAGMAGRQTEWMNRSRVTWRGDMERLENVCNNKYLIKWFIQSICIDVKCESRH